MLPILAEAAAAPAQLPPPEGTGFFPILLIFVLAAGFAFTQLIASSLLGPSRMGDVKALPYESGVDSIGDTHQPFVVQYYLVALIFLLFDVELAFLYPWGVIFRGEAVRPGGYGKLLLGSMFLFLFILGFAFLYAWKKGVFDWYHRKPQNER